MDERAGVRCSISCGPASGIWAIDFSPPTRIHRGAATTLLKVMVDVATPPSTRVRAAEAVLSHAAKAIEIEDLDARLKELEMAVEANKGGRR